MKRLICDESKSGIIKKQLIENPVKKTVLILGAGLRLTLVIARSLYRQGIPVVVAPIIPGEPPIRSRAIKRHALLPDFRTKPEDFIEALTVLIKEEDIDMIMPTGDGAMAAVGQHYDMLMKHVHVGSPPPRIMERVLDKRLTLAAAQKCGVPIAASRTVSEISDLPEIISGLRFPLIAKPAIRKGANTYRIKYFLTEKALLDQVAMYSEWLDGGLLQEYIPGMGKGVGVLMHKGMPVTMFQHRRLKEYPYTGGVSVMAQAEAVDPVLGEFAVKLLREIEWEGIAMVEYRFDPTTNNVALMEINGRYWGSLFLPAKVGIDFPYYEWQLAHGEQPSVPKRAYPIGLKVRWLAGDILRLRSILEKKHDNHIEPVSSFKEFVRFFTDFRARDAVFSWRDPMPAIQEFRETAGALLKEDVKHIITKALPQPAAWQIRIYRNLPSSLRSVFVKQQALRFLRKQPILFRFDADRINSVLFVCLGNVIRSPTAAISLKKKLASTEKENLEIVSAGLWEGLTRVEPRPSPEEVIKAASEMGLSLSMHRSQPITQELIDSSQVIFVMDYQNEAMLLARYPAAKSKIFLLGACVEKVPVADWEIPDPYGKEFQAIQHCLTRIDSKVNGLVKLLLGQ